METLVEVADTLLSPIRLFSGTDSDGDAKYTDVSDIPDKGTISIPNDASNESRALYLLQSAGLIELAFLVMNWLQLKTFHQIRKNLDIKEVDAAQNCFYINIS